MRSILFRTMEPMMFRGASEFSPTTRGPQTGAWSMPLPPPSTIAGALATLTLQHHNRPPPAGNASEWDKEVIDILGGEDSIVLRGPYLIAGEENSTLYVQYKGGVLPLGELTEHLPKGDLLSAMKKLDNAAKKSGVGQVDLVGIKLSDVRKAAETGWIYSSRMVDYAKIGDKKSSSSSIVIEVLKSSNLLDEALAAPKIIRLGGEGRLVEAVARELQPISEFLQAKNYRTRRLRLYVATPMLFEASSKLASRKLETSGVVTFAYHSLGENVRAYLNEVDFDVASVRVAGTLGILGGFSVAKAVRKPVYAALQPGSVIEVSRDSPIDQEECYKVYSMGLGLFRNLGYGTVIPIPVGDHA